MQNIKNLRKWSRGLRRGVSKFYEERSADALAYQLIKYRQRNGWTHADVVRLSHPKFPPMAEGLALKLFSKDPGDKVVPMKWQAFEEVQTLTNPKDKGCIKRVIDLVRTHSLPWEAISTELHGTKEIWEAMIPEMGLTALLRNLSRFARLEITNASGLDDTSKFIAARFRDVEQLKRSRLHPLQILNGMSAYGVGVSERNDKLRWNAAESIIRALDDAFYLAFGNVEPTGKNHLLGLDVSGSMSWGLIAGTSLTPRAASVAMALVTATIEPHTYTMGFSEKFVDLSRKIAPGMKLNQVRDNISGLPFGATDCALPMEWATKNKAPVDVFCIYTDSETYHGGIHPTQALERYRQKMGRDAKLVVIGMVSNGFTIADPTDPRQLDVVGFSLDTPQAISTFVKI